MTQRHLLFLAAFMIAGALWAQEIWELPWNIEAEKPRHRAKVAEYARRADRHLRLGNNFRARWFYRKLHRQSRTLVNRGNAVVGEALGHYNSKGYKDAADKLMQAVKDYGNYIDYTAALALVHKIAVEQFHGKRDILWASLDDRAFDIYKHISDIAPYSEYAPLSVAGMGTIRRRMGLNREAIIHYERFLDRYPNHKSAMDVRLRMIETLLDLAERSEGDALREKRVRVELARVLTASPDEKTAKTLQTFAGRADRVEARHLFFLATFYQRPVHYKPETSRAYLEDLIRRYPRSEEAKKAPEWLSKLPSKKVHQEAPEGSSKKEAK